MATTMLDGLAPDRRINAKIAGFALPKLALLIAGAVLSLFAVGGRWDVALAAWIFPALLLGYVRTTKPVIGLFAVWIVCVAGALYWALQLVIPLNAITTLACVAFGTIYSLPYVLDRLAGPRLGPFGRLFLFPAAVAASEFAMGVISPLGTAYGLKAVTQYADLPLLQVIAITGPYAIGFLIGWLATTLNWALETPRPWRTDRRPILLFVGAIAVILVGGALRQAFFAPIPSYVRIAGVVPSRAVMNASNALLGYGLQGGTKPPVKAELDRIDPARLHPAYALVHDELLANTRKAARAGAKVVVWSENAAVARAEDVPALLQRAAGVAREEHIYLDAAVNVPFVRDETHMFGPDGRELWTYNKAHPIPGLEVYQPGSGRVPVVSTPFGRIANVICYDADFPALLSGVKADILLVPGGDWPQMGRVHTLRMASLRAIENGFSLFRQDLNGLSAAFDHQGHVLSTQDTTTSDTNVFAADVPVRGSLTVYNQIGDVFAYGCVLLVVLLGGLAAVRRRGAVQP